jgi:hypothetical protein
MESRARMIACAVPFGDPELNALESQVDISNQTSPKRKLPFTKRKRWRNGCQGCLTC